MQTFSIRKLLLYLILAEILLLGGGQMIHLTGFLTLRMALWLLALIISFFDYRKVNTSIYRQSFIFLIVIFWASILGLIIGNPDFVFEDVKPISYFFIVFFFVKTVDSLQNIHSIIRLIKWSTFFMAFLYFICSILINRGVLNYAILFPFLSQEEFMFRSEEGYFFYKGFVFLPIGLLFFLRDKLIGKVIVLIFLVSIFFTYTRGFYIMAFLAFYFNKTIGSNGRYIKAIIFSSIILYVALSFGVLELFSDRAEESNGTRIITFQQVFERINFLSLFLGHGFGNGVPIRPGHFECSYLEIFHKQGLLGLYFWYSLFMEIRKCFNKLTFENKQYLKPMYIGVILIYIQSLFNPYLNNPIGMGFILITWACLLFLVRNQNK